MSENDQDKKLSGWDQLFQEAPRDVKALGAVTFLRRRTDTASHPVYLQCDDGKTYVVKPMRKDAEQGRMLFNDQIIARFGALVGAAVPRVSLVTVSQALIDLNPHPTSGLGHCKPGVCHGSELLRDVSERIDQFQHVTDDDNKNRFALLGVLHGWVGFSDRQFLYETVDPFRVSAVDHGHFFPNGPNWTTATLESASPPQVAADLIAACSLAPHEIQAACSVIDKVVDEDIARVLAIPPDEWGVKIDERVAVAKYLSARRDALLEAHRPKKEGEP
jgi:hypothetical protein